MNREEYIEFLKSKIEIAQETGLDIQIPLIQFEDGTQLKPHQRDGINWAIRGGRRALFESFGLGKTIQQLIICKTILENVPGKALIVAPLGVRQEFRRDAKNKMGIDIYYIKTQDDADALPDGSICITNYERVRDGDIDPLKFMACSLDEASILRSSGNRFLSPEEIKSMDYDKLQHFFKLYSLNTQYDYERHVQIAEELEAAKKLPSGWMLVAPESNDPNVWTDVTRIKTLNTSQSMGRKTMHLCPLQFDVVDRIINRYTNKGEWVYDPFGGISTVPYRAVKLGRKGIGCELNAEYYRDGLSYLRAAEMDVNTPTLFDLIEFEKEEAV